MYGTDLIGEERRDDQETLARLMKATMIIGVSSLPPEEKQMAYGLLTKMKPRTPSTQEIWRLIEELVIDGGKEHNFDYGAVQAYVMTLR